MKRFIILCLTLFCFVGCATTQSEPMSPTCKKLRRKMAYIKHTPGAGLSEEYAQLRQIAQEYDCPA